MLHSAFVTWRDRGAKVLVSASLNLTRGNFHKRVLGRRYMVKQIHGYRMWLDLEDPGISRSLLLFGTREVDHKIMLERALRPGMTVLDIGANIGYYALMELGLIGESGRLVAVEPAPANVDLLKQSLALNGYDHVAVVQGAISDRLGQRAFFLSHMSNLNTFHAVGTGAAHLSGETIMVDTFTVPQVMASHGPPDLVRMDVEGHEVEVINGMMDAIEAGEMTPMIIFETHISRYSPEHNMETALRALFARGYRIRSLSSSSESGTAIVDARGYRGSDTFQTDGVKRVIYENVSDDDGVDFICHTGGVRTVLMAGAE